MDIFNFNFQPYNIWANRNKSRQFKVNGMTADEWVASQASSGKESQELYNEFWHEIRPQILQENFNKIWSTASNPSMFPLDGVFRMLETTNTRSMLQTLNAMDQWEAFSVIKSKGGRAVGFDTETYGKAGSGHFGITEVAIGTRIYNSNGSVDTNGRSITFGINDSEYDYLMGLLNKFKASGWDALDERNFAEQTTLSRMSMYAAKGSAEFNNMFKQETLPEYGNKTFVTVGNLLPETRSASAIEAGIKALHKVHKQSQYTMATGLPVLMQYLEAANSDPNTVVFGANSEFDIKSISTVARAIGINTTNFESMRNSIIDVIYSARALAMANGEAIDTYFKNMSGVNVGASVDEQTQAYRMAHGQSHQGYMDVLNEGDINDIRVQEILDARTQMEEMQARYRRYNGANKSIFLINTGSLNQENALEMGVVNGKPVYNYTFTNEYWTIDTSHSKYIDVDGEQKYALTLNSYVEGQDASVVLVRDTQEEALEYLVSNSNIFNKEQVSQSNAIEQRDFKYRDYGRREFDKLINPASVARSGEADIYGFESLTGYLELIDKLPKNLKIDTSSESVSNLINYIEEAYSGKTSKEKPINGYYQAQAFAGMYEKIQNERELINDIVDKVKLAGNKATTNLDKTTIFNNAYNQAIEYLDTKYTRKKSKRPFLMSDALGIDIELPDGEIKRINAYSAESAAAGVRRIFKGLDSEDIEKTITNLHTARALISDTDKYNGLINRARTMTPDDLYGLSQDLGHELFKVTQGLLDSKNGIIKAFSKSQSANKNLQFFNNNMEDGRFIEYKGMSFSDAYKNSSDAISSIIDNATVSLPNSIYIDTLDFKKDDAFKNYINDIAARLNIEQIPTEGNEKTGGTLLYELFKKTKNYKGEETSYAINNFVRKGLRTHIAMGDNGNAYLFLTHEQDDARFLANFNAGKFDMSSRASLINPEDGSDYLSVHDYASVVEIAKINEYKLSGQDSIRTIKQGNIEEVIVPELNVSVGDNGKIRAYYNSGEFGYLSTLRQSMGGAIEHVLNREYEAGSRAVRSAQNAYTNNLSSFSSYRGRIVYDEAGNKSIQRIAEFTPNDWSQGRQANISNALYDLFKGATLIDNGDNLNIAQRIVTDFGIHNGLFNYELGQYKNIENVVNNAEFEEFFMKRLFTGTVAEDISLSGNLKGAQFDKNLFDIIKDLSNNTDIYDKSVSKALAKIPVELGVNQILSKGVFEKGGVTIGVKPGDYNDASSLYNPMRPTYPQQNNSMWFSVDEMDASKFIGFKGFSGFTGGPLRFTSIETELEYLDKKALAENGYQPVLGQDYSSRKRSMIGRMKQINDYDLQLRYQDIHNNAEAVAKEIGISKNTFDKAFSFFQQTYMSVYEDKMFLAPGLNEQILFQTPEAKKISYNLDSIDIERSRRLLNKYVREKTILDTDTVFAIRSNGTPIYYQGPKTRLESYNVTDFFENEKSYVLPITGDVSDNKIMIDGFEKATVRSIYLPSFKSYTGIKDDKEALRVANALFSRAFDGAIVAGNPGLEKHAGVPSIYSIWSTIYSNYLESGNGELLKNHLNRMIAENDAFSGFSPFKYIDGQLLSSNADAYNFSAAVETLYGQIVNDTALKSDINKKIVAELKYLDSNGLLNVKLHRQNMNEQTATRVVMDQRFEQSIVTRGMALGGDGMREIDKDWLGVLKAYSQGYTAKGTSLTGELKEFIDVFGPIKNSQRISLLNGKSELQRSVKGIVESLMYYVNPSKYSPEGKNIITININDLIDEGVKLKGGLGAKDLHDSIFFINGKPSKFLKDQARKSNVDLRKNSYSLFIDLNQIRFSITDKFDGKQVQNTYNGIMIPIQTVFDNVDDKVFFQGHQREVVKLVDKLIKITKNPQKYGNNIEAEIANTYKTFAKNIFSHLNYMKKDRDIYKAAQQTIMPTSQGYLAQDEAAPLVEEMMTKDMQDLIGRIRKHENSLKNVNPNNKEIINALDLEYKALDSKLKEIGNKIRTDDNYYSKLMSLNSNSKLRKASEVKINGKTHYGLAVAMSKEAFERQGVNVGSVGLEAFHNWETKNYKLEGIKDFSEKHNFANKKITIAKKINDLKIDGLKIDSSKSITEQLSSFIASQKQHGSALTIADLNKSLIENKGFTKVLNIFSDEIGETFLSEIGTYAEFIRYPLFESQVLVKVILDKNMSGTEKQLRLSSPIFSSETKVDFDGDHVYLLMPTDGISIMNEDTSFKINGKNVKALSVARELYEDFAVNKTRDLLAELIEDGEVFNTIDPNATIRQYAAMLKTFNTPEYEDAIMSWAKDNSIRVSSISGLTKAQLFAAETSSQMHDKFINMKFNPLTDDNSIIASIASRFRSKNIGLISTPNYQIRNSLLTAMQDPSMSSDQRQLLNDTFVMLGNLNSKTGGFFSAAEQKAIDVKWAKDGAKIARTVRYSAGINLLFGTNKHSVQSNLAGIRNILQATAPLFDTSEAELNKMASIVVESTMEKFDASVKEYGGKTEQFLRTLRKLLDVQAQIPNFDKFYANGITKNSLDNDIYEMVKMVEKLNDENTTDIMDKYLGTAIFNVIDMFKNPFSADKPEFIENNVYFQIGDINRDWVDKGFVYNDGKFTEIDMVTGELTKNGFKESELSLIDVKPGGVNIRNYSSSSTLRQQVSDAIAVNKFEKTLNSVLLDKNNKLLPSLPEEFIKVSKIKGGLGKFGATWSGVNALFKNPKTYANIAKLTTAYDYAVNKNFIDIAERPSTSGELIKQINKQIAANPKKYTEDYSSILHNEMAQVFGGSDILESYINESQIVSSVDIKKYKKTLDFLMENSYDILEQQNIISGSFQSIETEIEGLRKQGISDSELSGLQEILDSSKQTTSELLNAIKKENSKVISSAQKDIYNLFSSTQQMGTFFKWDEASDDTIVGFGEYIGKSFKELSQANVDYIIETGELAKKNIKNMTTKESYALTNTLNALSGYNAQSSKSALISSKTSEEVTQLLENNKNAIFELHKQLEGMTPEQIKKATERASEITKRKSLLDLNMVKSAKEKLSNIPKRNIGIAIGAMAALGIANNVLHNDKSRSPLTPAQSADTRNKPSTISPASKAPMSQKKTVYHDSGSGFNFKVSAGNSNYIDDQNNAKLIGMSGGGSPSIYSQTDTSGVTDNWLANKFAELM